MTTATLCERGQITIPKQFRTQLGFRPGMVFAFSVKGNSLFMTAQKPKKRLLDTGFSYFTASNISYAAERIRNVIKRTPLYCLISESSQRFVSAKS